MKMETMILLFFTFSICNQCDRSVTAKDNKFSLPKYNNKPVAQSPNPMFDLPQPDTPNPKQKTLYLIQNGHPDHIHKYAHHKPLTKTDIQQTVQKLWWNHRCKHLRIYGIDGIELFEEDLPYLKNGDRVYVSKGSQFDDNLNFGEYEMVRILGEGGFGSVSLGVNKITGEQVAIKVVKANKVTSSGCIDMIFRQAQNLKSLSHPNIVKIINCYSLKNMNFVIIMEYLEGGQLKQLLKNKTKFDEQQARVYFRQIVSAVSYCHRQGIVHRDLKLENILLSKDHQVKVADFGISGVADRFNPELDWGTLKYMPPEILSKKEKVNSFAGDVWACGIILFYMVEGYLPFSGNSSSQIVNRIIYYPVQFSSTSTLSQNCRDLIVRMLDKNHKQRITMTEIETMPWFFRGCEGSEQAVGESKLMQSESESFKQVNKPRKLAKKSTLVIPKRFQKQRNQLLEQLQGYRANRKLFKSQSKCLPQLRSVQFRNSKVFAVNGKLSHFDLQNMKKPVSRHS